MPIGIWAVTIYAIWLIIGIFTFLLIDDQRKPPRIAVVALLGIYPIMWLADRLEALGYWLFAYRS